MLWLLPPVVALAVVVVLVVVVRRREARTLAAAEGEVQRLRRGVRGLARRAPRAALAPPSAPS